MVKAHHQLLLPEAVQMQRRRAQLQVLSQEAHLRRGRALVRLCKQRQSLGRALEMDRQSMQLHKGMLVQLVAVRLRQVEVPKRKTQRREHRSRRLPRQQGRVGRSL